MGQWITGLSSPMTVQTAKTKGKKGGRKNTEQNLI
jgi:hypothetical protein